MKNTEINAPMAIGIGAVVVVLLIAMGMFFLNRKPAIPTAQQSAEDQKKQVMQHYGKH